MRAGFPALILSLNLVFVPSIGAAHSGGLNAQGCHAGSQPYHCHRAQAPRRTQTGPRIGDQDCADFATWREAQEFFIQAGPGDPHRLDADNDGISCEALR